MAQTLEFRSALFNAVIEEVKNLSSDFFARDRIPSICEFQFNGIQVFIKKLGLSGFGDTASLGYQVSLQTQPRATDYSVWVYRPQESNREANRKAAIAALGKLGRSTNLMMSDTKASEYLN